MPWLVWGWVFWIFVAGTFGVIMLYRALIGGKDDNLLASEAEVRRNARHRADVDRCARATGIASIAMLATLALLSLWRG